MTHGVDATLGLSDVHLAGTSGESRALCDETCTDRQTHHCLPPRLSGIICFHTFPLINPVSFLFRFTKFSCNPTIFAYFFSSFSAFVSCLVPLSNACKQTICHNQNTAAAFHQMAPRQRLFFFSCSSQSLSFLSSAAASHEPVDCRSCRRRVQHSVSTCGCRDPSFLPSLPPSFLLARPVPTPPTLMS